MENINIYPSLEDVRCRIISAIVNLYRYDRELIEINANERSITHKLAEHLQREFPHWHVDCEYNRLGRDIKKLNLNFDNIQADDLEAKTIFPDIIVHHRCTRDNLLVIEVKKADIETNTYDEEKLLAFGQDENYRYRFGLFLRLGSNGCKEVQFYIEGKNNREEGKLLHQLIQENLEVLGYGR